MTLRDKVNRTALIVVLVSAVVSVFLVSALAAVEARGDRRDICLSANENRALLRELVEDARALASRPDIPPDPARDAFYRDAIAKLDPLVC